MGFETLRGGGHPKTPDFEIRAVIFNVMSTEGDHELQLVEFEDGQFAILRDGQSVCDGRWNEAELDNCIQLYRHLSHGGGMIDDLMPGADPKTSRKHRAN